MWSQRNKPTQRKSTGGVPHFSVFFARLRGMNLSQNVVAKHFCASRHRSETCSNSACSMASNLAVCSEHEILILENSPVSEIVEPEIEEPWKVLFKNEHNYLLYLTVLRVISPLWHSTVYHSIQHIFSVEVRQCPLGLGAGSGAGRTRKEKENEKSSYEI